MGNRRSSIRALALALASGVALMLQPMVGGAALAGPVPTGSTTVPFRAGSTGGVVPGVAPAAAPNVNVTNKLGAQSETAVAIDPKDAMHLVAASNDLSSTMTVYESFDRGATWSNAGLSLTTFCYDPWVDFNAKGDLFVSYECSDQRYAYRLHGSSTWVTTTFPSSLAGSFPDRDMIVLDTNASSPFAGSAYIGYDDNGASNTAYVLYSRNGKTGWTRSPKINDSFAPTIGVNVAVGSGGTIYASWLDFSNKKLMVDRSTDGGATWGTDHVVHSYRVNTAPFFISIPPQPDRGIIPMPFSVGAPEATTYAGRVYEVYTDIPASGSHTNIYFTYSDDGGVTWSPEKMLNDDGGAAYQFFGGIGVSRSGFLGVAFYDTRRDPTSKKTDRFWTFSKDGGATWSVNKRLTTAQSDESGPGNPNDYGDYEGIDGGKTTLFAHSWADSRPGNLSEDMYATVSKVK